LLEVVAERREPEEARDQDRREATDSEPEDQTAVPHQSWHAGIIVDAPRGRNPVQRHPMLEPGGHPDGCRTRWSARRRHGSGRAAGGTGARRHAEWAPPSADPPGPRRTPPTTDSSGASSWPRSRTRLTGARRPTVTTRGSSTRRPCEVIRPPLAPCA